MVNKNWTRVAQKFMSAVAQKFVSAVAQIFVSVVAQIFVSVVAHFFVVVSGSKIHERVAQIFIDIYRYNKTNKSPGKD